jgi:hypothetical protein
MPSIARSLPPGRTVARLASCRAARFMSRKASYAVDYRRFPSPCVNYDTQRCRESTYLAFLPRLGPVANGGLFFEKRRPPPRAGLAHALAPIDRHMTAPKAGLTSGLPGVVQGLSENVSSVCCSDPRTGARVTVWKPKPQPSALSPFSTPRRRRHRPNRSHNAASRGRSGAAADDARGSPAPIDEVDLRLGGEDSATSVTFLGYGLIPPPDFCFPRSCPVLYVE